MELEYISLSFNSSLLIKCYSLSGLLVKGEWKCRHDSLTFCLALVFDTLFLPLIKSLMVSVPSFSFGFRINKVVAFQNSCVTLVLVFIFLPLLWRSSLPIVFFLSYWCWFFLCWSPAAFVFEIDVVAPSFFPLIFFFFNRSFSLFTRHWAAQNARLDDSSGGTTYPVLRLSALVEQSIDTNYYCTVFIDLDVSNSRLRVFLRWLQRSGCWANKIDRTFYFHANYCEI